MRIAYIVDGMWNSAGMERVISMKVNALCGEFDITMITREQEGRKPHFPLDSRIRMIDIGAKTKREYRQKLTPVLMRERFDICVDAPSEIPQKIKSLPLEDKKTILLSVNQTSEEVRRGKKLEAALIKCVSAI